MRKDFEDSGISDEDLQEVISEIKLLSKKWSPRIILSLMRNEILSFKQIREYSDGVSNKILSERLEQLQRGGIVAKENREYRLTPKGRALENVFDNFLEWKKEHES